ncbi:hypothetical protein B566_EDAN003761 [Ephemera danica]|nr:hypothetical protein B566_EDAN003761 [Ephemera danica]
MAGRADSSLGYSYHMPTASLCLRIRNALSQFSDLFSEFNKYIAPAYHHDRCERSVQMRLYTMHKREFVMVFVAFFACFGLGVFIGIAVQRSSQLLPRLNGSDIACGPFVMRSPPMTTYSQQLWVIAKVKTANKDDETYDKSFHVSVTIEGITADHIPAMKQECDDFIVMHLGFLDYTHYIVTVHFFGLESFHQRYTIKEVTFYFKSYNPDFTQIEIWFRVIFLLMTFVVTLIINTNYNAFSVGSLTLSENTPCLTGRSNRSGCHCYFLFYFSTMAIQCFCTCLTDPIFPMTFLMNSSIPGMLDAVFQASFLCALLLFWLCIYHGLRQNERHLLKFYAPKCLIVGMLWLSAIVMATWQEFNELRDPTYSYKLDTNNFYSFKVFFFVVGGMYLTYLLYLIMRAYTDLRAMPFFDMRLKFLTLLMLIVLSISITITVLRFGVGILEDNFVAELSTTYKNSAEFMSFYGLLNFYLYTMAYVYAPSQPNVFEAPITKDNPAFSMINDSDEEVVYGSDEESRQPLTRTHDDDSD